jgi:tRNA threonylcarbamoyladenosine biosynthesis protein TsaB
MSETWLLLETSERGGRVGVAVAGKVARAAQLDAARRHNRDLAPAAAEVLRAVDHSPNDLTGVMVSVGPGSYTGLRVGVMSAKALAYATGCRLVAVPTFHAIAEQAPPEAEAVEVIADALQGLVYAQRFRRAEGGEWAPVNELRIEPARDWATRLGEGVWVSGPGLALNEHAIPNTLARVEVERRRPELDALLRVGLRLPPLTAAEVMRLEPLYLRGSSAEEKAKAGERG